MPHHICIVYQSMAIPFLFEAAEALGHSLTLILRPGERAPDYPNIRQAVIVDIYGDETAAIERIRALHAEDPFDGILSIWEPALPFTARAARALGLRFLDEQVAVNCRNKARMRACFRAAGANCPRFVHVEGVADIPTILAELSFPLVIKPAAGYGSMGVIRVNAASELEAALRAVLDLRAQHPDVSNAGESDRVGLMVEEYIDGPEYVAETFAQNGRVHVLTIGDKGYPTGPYFEETIYRIPARLTPELEAAVVVEVRRAALALGITDGPSHVELRLRNGTTPYVLEIGARIGGSSTSHFMVWHATDINFAELLFENAVGPVDCTALPLTPAPKRVIGWYIIPVGEGGVVERIHGLDEVDRLPFVIRTMAFARPGSRLQRYPDFVGYAGIVASRHDSMDEGEAFHRELETRVRVVYQHDPQQKMSLVPEDAHLGRGA